MYVHVDVDVRMQVRVCMGTCISTIMFISSVICSGVAEVLQYQVLSH